MKIAIEAQRLFREKKHGMEIVAQEIINELQQIDRQNQYFIYLKDGKGVSIKETENFKIKKINSNVYPIWEQFSLPAQLKKDKPDLLHCTANTAPIFCKIPMVITIHDVMYMESVSFKGTNYQNFGNLYRKLIVPVVAKKSKIIITVSEFEKQNIAKLLKIDDEKIRVVYNGLNASFNNLYNEEKLNDCRKRHNLPKEFIFHIGNKAPRKNTKGVLIAYSEYFKNNKIALPLVISGCEPEFVWQLIDHLQLSAIKANVQTTGYISATDLPLFYNLATLFLYPSFREGFGMPVIESMACGTPVITGNNSSLLEVANGAALLVDAANPLEISKSILNALDKNLYLKLKEKGIENAKRFNWKKSAEKTLDIYHELERELK